MKKNIEVSFITINYNGFKDTCELIESIQKNITQVCYELIVVDNASSQNEALLLEKKYPAIIAIRSEENLGFAGGNNLGIEKAIGKYLFFINNDTYILSDGTREAINFLNTSSKRGGISPKIKYADPPNNIQFAGFTPLSPITLRNRTIGIGETDNGNFDMPHSTPYLHGAAMFIKKECIEKIGLMPSIYFLYYEEIDWSTHITNQGYQLWYYPYWTIFHKESQSTGKESKLQVFYMTRNRLLYAWRNLHGINRWFSLLYQIVIASTKNSLKYLLIRRIDLYTAVFKGIISFFGIIKKK